MWLWRSRSFWPELISRRQRRLSDEAGDALSPERQDLVIQFVDFGATERLLRPPVRAAIGIGRRQVVHRFGHEIEQATVAGLIEDGGREVGAIVIAVLARDDVLLLRLPDVVEVELDEAQPVDRRQAAGGEEDVAEVDWPRMARGGRRYHQRSRIHLLRAQLCQTAEPSQLAFLWRPVGPSGRSRSTLLNIMGGIDRDKQSSLQGCRDTELDDSGLSAYGGGTSASFFSFFSLIPSLTAYDNVALLTEIADDRLDSNTEIRAIEALPDINTRLGTTTLIHHAQREHPGRCGPRAVLRGRPHLADTQERNAPSRRLPPLVTIWSLTSDCFSTSPTGLSANSCLFADERWAAPEKIVGRSTQGVTIRL
jgi:hypothetical protein